MMIPRNETHNYDRVVFLQKKKQIISKKQKFSEDADPYPDTLLITFRAISITHVVQYQFPSVIASCQKYCSTVKSE